MSQFQQTNAPVVDTKKSEHPNAVLSSLSTASIHLASNGAINPVMRAILTGIHVAIESTKDQKHFLDGLYNKLSISAPETFQGFSNLVAKTPLADFSAKFALNETPAARMILEGARKKVGELDPTMTA